MVPEGEKRPATVARARCTRRISSTATSTDAGLRCGHEIGRSDRSTSPAWQASSYGLSQTCTVCRDTPRWATDDTG